jgi:hypothetical protein
LEHYVVLALELCRREWKHNCKGTASSLLANNLDAARVPAHNLVDQIEAKAANVPYVEILRAGETLWYR